MIRRELLGLCIGVAVLFSVLGMIMLVVPLTASERGDRRLEEESEDLFAELPRQERPDHPRDQDPKDPRSKLRQVIRQG